MTKSTGSSAMRGSVLTQIRSSHGDPLFADPRTGAVVAGMVNPPARLLPIFAIVSLRALNYIFLVAGGEVPCRISVVEDPLLTIVLSYYQRRVEHRVNLQCPGTLRHVTVLPPDLDPSGRLRCDRVEASDWENFIPERCPASPSSFVKSLAIALDNLFETTLSARSVCEWLGAQPSVIAGACGAAVIRLLPYEELDKIARMLLRDEPSKLLTQICLDDPAVSSTFQALRDSERAAAPSRRITIGPEFDHLGLAPAHLAVNPPLPVVLRACARSFVEPTRDLCVVATARNEGVYFIDWIAHHRSIGVEHFFIYSNNNDDNSDELLGALADAGVITWIDNVVGVGVRPMLKAYTHALSEFSEPLAFRWTLILDLDEYLILNPARHFSLPNLLRTRYSAGATAVAFHWLIYVPGSDLRWDPAPMLTRFGFREPEENRHVKTAFQTRCFTSSMPHDPEPRWGTAARFQKASGAPHHWTGKMTPPSEGEPEYSDAWVNHYFFKSVDEHVWKRSRGGGDDRGALPLSFDPKELYGHLKWHDLSRAKEDRNALHHVEGLQREAVHLRNLPKVAEAEARVRATFGARVARLRLKGLSRLKGDRGIKPAEAEIFAAWLDGEASAVGGQAGAVSEPCGARSRRPRRRS